MTTAFTLLAEDIEKRQMLILNERGAWSDLQWSGLQHRGYMIETTAQLMNDGKYRGGFVITPIDEGLPTLDGIMVPEQPYVSKEKARARAEAIARVTIARLLRQTVEVINGKIYALLNATELSLLNFYRDRGRKYGVIVTIENKADPDMLAQAKSQQEAEAILRSANSIVLVTVADV